MRIECLEGNELRKTRTLYETVFRDSKEYTDYFYNKVERDGKAFVAINDDDEIVAEVFLLPKLLSCEDKIMDAMYVYGVATKETYRGQGIMRQLMTAALHHAGEKNAELVYLIPADEKIYEGFGFETVKQGEIHTWELSGKEAGMMLKFNLESLTMGNFNDEIYREINFLENEIKEAGDILPFRDKEYLEDRILRAEIDGGGVYLLRKRRDYSIAGIIITGEEQGETVILDVIGEPEKKEGFVKDFMRWKGSMSMKEYVFPVMMKRMDEEKIKEWKVLLNDEI